MNKRSKYLVSSITVLAVTVTVVLIFMYKDKSFKGTIESVRNESYLVEEKIGFFMSPYHEIRYQVKRIYVRTKRGEILDLAIYGGDLDKESVGKFMKGSYRSENLLKIKGKKVILGFADFPGPEIRLEGNPTGVIKRYRIIQ